MSLLLKAYRKNVAAAVLEAQRSTLPNVKSRAKEASARWAEMADRLEWVEEQGRVKIDAVVSRGPNQ